MTGPIAALDRCGLRCVTVPTTGPRHFFTLQIKQTVNKYVICQEVIGLIRGTKHKKGLEKAGQRLPFYVGGRGLRLEGATSGRAEASGKPGSEPFGEEDPRRREQQVEALRQEAGVAGAE